MPAPLEKARHFRSRAMEWQRLAQRTSSLTLQNHYLSLERSYAKLAEAEESSLGPSPRFEEAHLSESAE